MILLTLNIRGVGGSLKTASFRRLLSRTSPNIIFLQETMVNGQKSRSFLNQFHPNWLTSSQDSIGTSGGLAVSWDPSIFYLIPHLCSGGILLTGTCLWNNQHISLLNTYGPCTERKLFWDKVANRGLLDLANLIIAGDLNLTTSVGEVWGTSASTDPLASYFKNLFQAHALVDILPTVIVPTWRNGRAGSEAIKKRLDRVLISETLATLDGRIRSWVEYPFLSDHAPVLLQLETTLSPKAYPFKLNSSWLQEEKFNDIVKEVWTDPLYNTELEPQHRLVWKLKSLKSRIKQWARNYRQHNQARLLELEHNIQSLLLEDMSVGGHRDRTLTLTTPGV
jgi:endonuclease/exonuclease/phosphatase family metal-dependent hydrolase